MENKQEWIKCSAVAVGFYLIVYILLAHYFWGFLNPWLILVILLLLAGDIWGLKWMIQRQVEERDKNDNE